MYSFSGKASSAKIIYGIFLPGSISMGCGIPNDVFMWWESFR